MIDIEALFKVTYGLYIVCSGDRDHGNGFISNTVFQVTANPASFASCCSKDNYTASLIQKHACFSASILHKDTPSEIYGRFGYRSGRDFDKLDGMNVIYGDTGAPIVLNEAIASIECKVVNTLDVGTHWLFIGEVINAEVYDEILDPITYQYYRDVKKGLAPKNAPTYVDKSKLKVKSETSQFAKYKCAACGYIYDEEKEDVKFDDLPDDWICPLCGSDKEDFYKL